MQNFTKYIDFWKKNKLGFLVLLLIIFIGIVTRFGFIHYYIEFSLDQGRDAISYAAIKDGILPTLGPQAAYYGFHIPPWAFYIPLPFTILLSNPIYQVIPFAIMSFGSIFLLMRLIYNLFDSTDQKKRLILSLGGGLLWSVFTYDLLTASFYWNPHPIPFFLLLYFLIFNKLSNKHISLKKFIFWTIILGFAISVLVSTQGLLMVTIPLFTAILCGKFCFEQKDKKRAFVFLIALIFSGILFLSPYIYGEIGRNWQNTSLIISSVLEKAGGTNSASGNKLSRFVGIFVYSWDRGFLQGLAQNLAWLPALIFTFLGAGLFRGNKKLFSTIMIFFVVYLAAFSMHSDKLHYHYFYPLFIFPIVFILSAVNYFWINSEKFINKLGLVITSIFFLALIAINIFGSINYLNRKVHIINTYDKTEALRNIPNGEKVCFEGILHVQIDQGPPFRYLDKYLLNKSHQFEEECSSGSYYIYPKYQVVAGQQFQYTDNKYDPQENLELIYQSERYSLFLVK